MKEVALSQTGAFARIRQLRSPNIGPVGYRQLLARFGSAGAALDALPDLASRGKGPYRPATAEGIEREVGAGHKQARAICSAISPIVPGCWPSSILPRQSSPAGASWRWRAISVRRWPTRGLRLSLAGRAGLGSA